MHNYSNTEIADLLELTANLLELHNENPFKIRALNTAQYKIKKIETPLINLPFNELEKLEGIGKGIAQKIIELNTKGITTELEELNKKTPQGLLDLFKVKGLGPKKIAKLWQELGIESLGELMYACKENRLTDLKGFGEKTQSTLIENIQFILNNKDWMHYADAEIIANQLVEFIKTTNSITRVFIGGQLARKCEVINEIELVVCGDTHNKYPTVFSGLNVKVITCAENEFDFYCFISSSSNEHIEQLKKINPIILKEKLSDKATYQKLKIPYIFPELREGNNEITLALNNQLPVLIELNDLKGIIHTHTTYSDGQSSLSEMAKAAKQLGYEYLVISDHSQSAYYAGGLAIEKIQQQHAEINELNKLLAPFKIFKGIESDIRTDGSLDYEENILKTFDVIIASIHQGFAMDEQHATNRLIKAIENPYTTILGHLTGRLLLSRKGYPVNHKKIIEACATNNVVIELNAHPYRLDIDWRWISYCIEKEVMISINPDAHTISGYNDMQYGINAARKGMLTSRHCFNALNLIEIEKYLKNKSVKKQYS